MKAFVVIMSSLSGLLAVFTTICGAWIRANGGDAGSIAIHGFLGAGTTIAAVVAAILVLIYVSRG